MYADAWEERRFRGEEVVSPGRRSASTPPSTPPPVPVSRAVTPPSQFPPERQGDGANGKKGSGKGEALGRKRRRKRKSTSTSPEKDRSSPSPTPETSRSLPRKPSSKPTSAMRLSAARMEVAATQVLTDVHFFRHQGFPFISSRHLKNGIMRKCWMTEEAAHNVQAAVMLTEGYATKEAEGWEMEMCGYPTGRRSRNKNRCGWRLTPLR